MPSDTPKPPPTCAAMMGTSPVPGFRPSIAQSLIRLHGTRQMIDLTLEPILMCWTRIEEIERYRLEDDDANGQVAEELLPPLYASLAMWLEQYRAFLDFEEQYLAVLNGAGILV